MMSLLNLARMETLPPAPSSWFVPNPYRPAMLAMAVKGQSGRKVGALFNRRVGNHSASAAIVVRPRLLPPPIATTTTTAWNFLPFIHLMTPFLLLLSSPPDTCCSFSHHEGSWTLLILLPSPSNAAVRSSSSLPRCSPVSGSTVAFGRSGKEEEGVQKDEEKGGGGGSDLQGWKRRRRRSSRRRRRICFFVSLGDGDNISGSSVF